MKLRLFPRLHAARVENKRLRHQLARCDLLIAYQRARMKEMAGESLGMRVSLAQLAPPRRRPSTVDATVVLDKVVAR